MTHPSADADVPQSYIEDPPSYHEGEGGSWRGEPVTVVDVSERHTPEFSSCMTWLIPQVGVGQPVQILQRQPQRFKAKLIVVNAGTSLVFNSKLDPLQGATPQGFTIIAVGSLPDWESQQPLYVVATGTGGIVSVYDETFSRR